MCEYGMLIVDDLLGIDISYYTVVDQKAFRTAFKKKTYREVTQDGENVQVQNVACWIYKDHYKKKLKNLQSEEKTIKDYLEVLYENGKSNLHLSAKKQYAGDYMQWEIDNTYFHILPGVSSETVYEAKTEEARELLEEILNHGTYGVPQLMGDSSLCDSRDCTIEILNASQINGLAAKYQEMLEEQGYTISSIGNYMGMMQTSTSIVVKSTDMGADLLLYLEGAQLSVSDTLPENVDIQIILGTDANIE